MGRRAEEERLPARQPTFMRLHEGGRVGEGGRAEVERLPDREWWRRSLGGGATAADVNPACSDVGKDTPPPSSVVVNTQSRASRGSGFETYSGVRHPGGALAVWPLTPWLI